MPDRIQQLESTILELGAEMYRLRSEHTRMVELQDKFSKAVKSLRALLDEKGFVSSDEFDTAVDLSELPNPRTPQNDEVRHSSGDWKKKSTH